MNERGDLNYRKSPPESKDLAGFRDFAWSEDISVRLKKSQRV
jgi:hypothetical protein